MPQIDIKLKNGLIALLTFLRKKAEAKHLRPEISTDKLIDMLKISGMLISKLQLKAATADPEINAFIKNLDNDKIIITTEEDDIPEEPITDFGSEDVLPEDMQPTEDEGFDSSPLPSTPPPPEQNLYPEETGPSGKEIVGQMALRAMRRQ